MRINVNKLRVNFGDILISYGTCGILFVIPVCNLQVKIPKTEFQRESYVCIAKPTIRCLNSRTKIMMIDYFMENFVFLFSLILLKLLFLFLLYFFLFKDLVIVFKFLFLCLCVVFTRCVLDVQGDRYDIFNLLMY